MMMNARPEVRGAHIGSRSHFQGARARDIEKRKDELLDNISKRIEQKIDKKELFTIRWGVQ
jgi:hypothetical protein